MKVIYKCRCMDAERSIDVTARVPEGDLQEWMEGVVINCVAYDHAGHYPNCQSTHMDWLKIPMIDEEVPIGVDVARN
jgi:hypothetical protein